ncbi:MAG: hypothetical protein ACPGYV_10115, partial [Phycisphaeraceae bacterium]
LRTVLLVLLVVLPASLLGGCTPYHRAPYTAEVGSVSMTASCLGRWEDLRSKLSPGFDLDDGDEAMKLVVPQTARFQSRRLDATSLGLAATFPATQAPASVGDDGSFGGRTAAGLPTIGSLLGEDTLDTDPVLRFQLANALFQEVQLLNEYITRTAIPEGYSPYVVRLLLRPDVNPWFDDVDLDAYTTVSFFKNKDKTEDADPLPGGEIRVMPLLVTDHIEAALASRNIEELRRLALVLSVADNQIGGSANYQSLMNSLEESLALEQNSLISVSRESENSIRVRLGGNYTTQAKRIATRNHPITLVVLVRDTPEERQARIDRFAIAQEDAPSDKPKDDNCKGNCNCHATPSAEPLICPTNELSEGRSLRVSSFTRFRLTDDLAQPGFLHRPFSAANRRVTFTQVTPLIDYAALAKDALLDAVVSGQVSLASPIGSVVNFSSRDAVWSRVVGAINCLRCSAGKQPLSESDASGELLKIAMLVANNDRQGYEEEMDRLLNALASDQTVQNKVPFLLDESGKSTAVNLKQVIWTIYVELFGAMEYARTDVSLPLPRKPTIQSPNGTDRQVAHVSAKNTTVLLTGTNLDAGNIQASLSIPQPAQAAKPKADDASKMLSLTAVKLKPNASGTQMLLEFDTQGLFKGKDTDPKDGKLHIRWRNPDGQTDIVCLKKPEEITCINLAFVNRGAAEKKAPEPTPQTHIEKLIVDPDTLREGRDLVVRLKPGKQYDPENIKSILLVVSMPATRIGGNLGFESANGHTTDTYFKLDHTKALNPALSDNFQLKDTLPLGSKAVFSLIVTPVEGQGPKYTVNDAINVAPKTPQTPKKPE